MNASQELKKKLLVVSKTGVILQEILAVIAGTKPCFIMDLNEKRKRIIIREFPELSIECKQKIIVNRKITVCVLSKKKEIAKEAINFFTVARCNLQKTGELLGYPKCCIKSHFHFVKHGLQHYSPVVTYQSYQNSKQFNFLTNNILNFSTRLYTKEDYKKLDQYFLLNKRSPIPLTYLQFISHIPCSYNCQESIKIGKEIDALLKKYVPQIEKVVKYTLSKPILFFDLFKWIILDGYVRENILFYKKIIPPVSPTDFLLFSKIIRGNKIIIREKTIEIFKDNLSIYSYFKKDKKDGFILDFKEK